MTGQQAPSTPDRAETLDITNRDSRMRHLQQLALKAEREGKYLCAARILGQAAAELRAAADEIAKVNDGLPEMTPEQARKEIEEFLTEIGYTGDYRPGRGDGRTAAHFSPAASGHEPSGSYGHCEEPGRSPGDAAIQRD